MTDDIIIECAFNRTIERFCYWLLIPLLLVYGIGFTGVWL